MRLTLRNLLRFLDQSDMRSVERKQLKQLVDRSEKAADWILRFELLRKSSTVGAPGIDEGGMRDIFVVAQYLDMRLGESETIEFEQQVLASDELMAELASCHSIRESIKESAEVPISLPLRQLIYDLCRQDQETGNEKSATTPETESVASLAMQMVDLPFVDRAPESDHESADEFEFPSEAGLESTESETVSIDQLSKRARNQSSLVTIVLFVMVLGMVGMAFYLGRESVNFSAAKSDGSNSHQTDQQDNLLDETAKDSQSKLSSQASTTSKAKSVKTTDQSPMRPPVDDGDKPGQITDKSVDENLLIDDHPQLPEPSDPIGDTDEIKLPQAPQLTIAKTIQPANDPAIAVAKLSPGEQVVFQARVVEGQWQRVSHADQIVERTEMLVLEGNESSIDVNDTIQLTIAGPARFALGTRDKPTQADLLIVQYGRFLIKSKKTDVDFLVQRESHQYRLTFPLANATVEFQSLSFVLPGIDPEQQPSTTVESVINRGGRCNLKSEKRMWPMHGTKTLQRIWAPDGQVTDRVGMLVRPTLLEVYQQRMSRISSQEVGLKFTDDKSLERQLIDMIDNNRKEIRAMAIAGLAIVENFEFLVDYLDDENNSSYWRTVTDAIRFQMVNQPGATGNLLQGFSVAGDEQQQQLYQLMIGTSQLQLESGRDQELVELLDHSSLPIRVMAIDNLRFIRNGLTYSYLPWKNRIIRRRHIRNWQRDLEKGAIRYERLPDFPLAELQEIADDNPAEIDAVDDTDPANDGSDESSKEDDR